MSEGKKKNKKNARLFYDSEGSRGATHVDVVGEVGLVIGAGNVKVACDAGPHGVRQVFFFWQVAGTEFALSLLVGTMMSSRL